MSAVIGKSLPAAALAELLGGRLEGDPELQVSGVADLAHATALEAAVLFDRRQLEAARSSAAGLLVLAPDSDVGRRTLLRVENPRAALIVLLERFHPSERAAPGVMAGAFVEPSAVIHPSAHVAAGSHVGAGAELAAGVEIHAGAVVGERSIVGEGSILHPRVVLYPGTRIGARVEIHAGSVIGSPGFGYLREADGRQRRIPQSGWVEIEDDVEIGALAAVDRATFGATRIRRGAKLDNLVQIGHNSDIGEDCCLAAQVGISGSVEIGARSTLLGQVGVADHSKLAPGAVVAAQSGVVGRIGPGEWLGTPAIPLPIARRAYGLIARLPAMFREIRRLRALLLDRTGTQPPGNALDSADPAGRRDAAPPSGGVD